MLLWRLAHAVDHDEVVDEFGVDGLVLDNFKTVLRGKASMFRVLTWLSRSARQGSVLKAHKLGFGVRYDNTLDLKEPL